MGAEMLHVHHGHSIGAKSSRRLSTPDGSDDVLAAERNKATVDRLGSNST